jgi:hypothetical protein
MRPMTILTRRRDPHLPDCWRIHYGDVQVGTVAKAIGTNAAESWRWSCGFYPGSNPGEHRNGTASSLEEARLAFEAAWDEYLLKRTEADFQAWRDQRDWTERKYAMWERGDRLPAQSPSSLMRCVCGETFDSHDPAGSHIHRQHIHATQGIS